MSAPSGNLTKAPKQTNNLRGVLITLGLGVVVLIGSFFITTLSTGALFTSIANRVTATPLLSSSAMTATALCLVPTREGDIYVMGYEIYGTPTATATTPGDILTATPLPTQRGFVGNSDRGERVYLSVGMCNSCHILSGKQESVGPSLEGIATRAATRYEGLSARDYMRNVILDPDKWIKPLTKPGVMPTTYRYRLNDQQLEDLLDYLMQLK